MKYRHAKKMVRNHMLRRPGKPIPRGTLTAGLLRMISWNEVAARAYWHRLNGTLSS